MYSGGVDLDILPSAAGKGRAARFLAESWAIATDDVLAFGDSGNDAELLGSGFRGTAVANAFPELLAATDPDVYRSPKPFADGVLDGIRHWSHPAERRDREAVSAHPEPSIRGSRSASAAG